MSNKKNKNTYSEDYVIYSRKSTDDADNQKNSIDYQIGQATRFAEASDLTIAKFDIENFLEQGIIKERHSAFKTNDIIINKNGKFEFGMERPKFQLLVQKLMNKEFKGVICLCWDRISRNSQDDMVIKSLMDRGVDVRFVQANYEKTSSGALHMDIDGMFSAHYSRVISEKVKGANEKLRSEGKCTNISPIGYLDNGSDNKSIDPERASIVKRIFEKYSDGNWSLAQLAKWANKQGLTMKPQRRRRTKIDMSKGVEPDTLPKISRPLNNKSIEHILNNPFYIGKLRLNKKSKEYTNGIHQPLIDISLYNKVQEVLKSRNVSVYYIDMPFFIYRGLIRCSCGRAYSPYTKKGINYYRCRCKEDCTNTEKNIKETELNKIIEEMLEKISFTDEELAEIETRAKSSLDTINTTRNKELDDLHTERKKILSDLNYLTKNKITLLRSSAMDIEGIAKEERNLSEQLSLVEEKTKAHTDSAGEMLKYVITFSELVKMANLYYEHALDSEKREIATNVFTELIISNKNIEYKPKEGFETLFNRHFELLGSPDYQILELFDAYCSVKISMASLKSLVFLRK